MKAKVRLYVDHPLGEGQPVPLTREQAHYLFGVMRLAVGDAVALINGRDGEWQADIAEAAKKGGVLLCTFQSAALQMPPDIWLCFAPIKKARTDFIIEKAVELGARRILPVQTQYTNAGQGRRDRMQAHATEAAEQCGATYVPTVDLIVPLAQLLSGWNPDRTLIFCDEAQAGSVDASRLYPPAPAALLIGPEGGFSPSERDQLRSCPFAKTIGLGPRILRADTAAVSALTLWQAAQGDWI